MRGRRAGLRRRPYEEERGCGGGGKQGRVNSDRSRPEDGRALDAAPSTERIRTRVVRRWIGCWTVELE